MGMTVRRDAIVGRQPGMRGIVVGVDGSVASLAALRWAGREARLRGTPIHVVRAVEDEPRLRAPYASRHRMHGHGVDRAAVGARLEETARDALGPQPEPLVVEVADGLAARVLLERAAGADLLVLGISAHSAPDTLGPVAQVCLRNAPCPVVVVGAGQQPAAEPRVSSPAAVHALA
jgi:nucleotide-binding universal stress UspA family protein